MNVFSFAHLHWVLWIWLLLQESNGEDGVAKTERRLTIKQESRPGGESMARSFVLTRVSRAFSSSSTYDDDSGTGDDKSPDDRQSTIRIRNETVDLSKNTVPVLKYAGPTEPSLKEKYKRTTLPSETTPFRKALKLKRNMTRHRPADLTTLLAFNALTPSPATDSQQVPKMTTRPRPLRHGYLSTTQVVESMPPTAWALASLKGPTETTNRPAPPNVKPFISWSARLNKTTTSPTTEATELITGHGQETTMDPSIREIDITAEGVDMAATTLSDEEPAASTELPSYIKIPTEKESQTPSDIEQQQSTETESPIIARHTLKPQDITSDKPEENTISAPSLISLKNSTKDDFMGKKDSPSSFHYYNSAFISSTSMPVTPSTSDNIHSSTNPLLSSFSLSSSFNKETDDQISADRIVSNSTFIPSITKARFDSNNTSDANMTSLSDYNTFSHTDTEITVNSTDPPLSIIPLSSISHNNSGSPYEEKEKQTTSEETEVSPVDVTTVKIPYEESRLNEKIVTEVPETEKITVKLLGNDLSKAVHEVDPSLNTINEKKHDSSLLTISTVVSTVNSTTSAQMSPIITTPANENLANFMKQKFNTSENEYDSAKNLPLTVETTTVPTTSTTTSSPPSPLTMLNKEDHPSQKVAHNDTVINQTSNDIKPVIDEKPNPVSLETNTEASSSTRSNEIRHDNTKLNLTSNDNKPEQKEEPVELPGTTQSNYIQLHESIKPQNKTLVPQTFDLEVHNIEKSKEIETTLSPITTSTIITTMTPTFNFYVPTIPQINETSDSMTTDNSSSTAIVITPTTSPPITTTPPSTTTILLELVTLNSSLVPIINDTETPVTTMPDNTTKSNDMRDQETFTDIYFPVSEKNVTLFQHESPNKVRNESTTLKEEPDETDEDDGILNHTDFFDNKTSSDPINNGDSEFNNEDSFPEITVKSSLNTSIVSLPTITPSVTPTVQPNSTKISSTTENLEDVIPTQIGDDQPIIEDVYDPVVFAKHHISIVFEAGYSELCRYKDQLRDAIVRIFKKYAERTIDKRQVMLVSLGSQECSGLRSELDQQQTPVQLMLTDSLGDYDKALNDLFISLIRHQHLDFKYPIVEKVNDQAELEIDTDSKPSGTVVAAIIISSIAGVCLFALTILLVIMRKRQTGFNYGQRCTPVSLDDYSLDNISVYNSVRRKAMRASKRSYGNPAFDDPDVVSNPVNFAGLANFSSDKSKTDEEFLMLPQVVVKPDELPVGAELKNRYANVIPLPETRVQLKGNTPANQFINANYVKGVKGTEKFYIACQAPMQNTIDDFWQMVWDDQCRLIIMLTALNENGVEKCADYLPPSEVLDCHRVFGDLQVTLKKREAREKYVISSLQLKNLETNLWREVTHMWYAGWPPTGVPPEPSSVIAFLIEARSYSKGAPIVVHCSPGTGRTGTVIAIDIAIRDFEAGRSVDIPKTVVQVRRGRSGAVQTKDQYHFIYKVLHLYATKLTGGGLDSI